MSERHVQLDEAGQYELVHFTGHSHFDESNPFFSHLKLVDKNGQLARLDVDGIIADLRLPKTRLMIWMILTQWNVEDKPSRDLMVEFYRELANGKTLAEALRCAQLTSNEQSKSGCHQGQNDI